MNVPTFRRNVLPQYAGWLIQVDVNVEVFFRNVRVLICCTARKPTRRSLLSKIELIFVVPGRWQNKLHIEKEVV
jgi:hypothetical protein